MSLRCVQERELEGDVDYSRILERAQRTNRNNRCKSESVQNGTLATSVGRDCELKIGLAADWPEWVNSMGTGGREAWNRPQLRSSSTAASSRLMSCHIECAEGALARSEGIEDALHESEP